MGCSRRAEGSGFRRHGCGAVDQEKPRASLGEPHERVGMARGGRGTARKCERFAERAVERAGSSLETAHRPVERIASGVEALGCAMAMGHGRVETVDRPVEMLRGRMDATDVWRDGTRAWHGNARRAVDPAEDRVGEARNALGSVREARRVVRARRRRARAGVGAAQIGLATLAVGAPERALSHRWRRRASGDAGARPARGGDRIGEARGAPAMRAEVVGTCGLAMRAELVAARRPLRCGRVGHRAADERLARRRRSRIEERPGWRRGSAAGIAGKRCRRVRTLSSSQRNAQRPIRAAERCRRGGAQESPGAVSSSSSTSVSTSTSSMSSTASFPFDRTIRRR